MEVGIRTMNHFVWALYLSYIIAINGGMSEEKSNSSSSNLEDTSQANNTFYRPNNLNHERFVMQITEDEQIMSDKDKPIFKKDIDCIVTDLIRKTLEDSIEASNKGNESVLTGRIFHKTLQKLKRPLNKYESGFVVDSRVKSIPLYSGPMQVENEKSMPALYYDRNLCSALVPSPDETDLPYEHTNINIDSNVTRGNGDVQEEGDNEDIGKTKLTNSKTDLIKLIIAVYPFQAGFLDGSLIRNLYRRRNTIGPFEKRRATKISKKDKCVISAQSNSLNDDIKYGSDDQETVKNIINYVGVPKFSSFTTSRIESLQASKVCSKLTYPNQKRSKDGLNDFQNLLYPFLHHNNDQTSELKGRCVNTDNLKNENQTLPLEHKFKNISLVVRDQISNTSNYQEEPFLKIRAKNGPITLTLRYGSKRNNNMTTPNSVTASNCGNDTSFNTTLSLLKNNSVGLREAFFEFSKPFNLSYDNIKALKTSAISNSKKTSKSLKNGLLDLLNVSSPRNISMNKNSNTSSDMLNKSPDEEVIIEPENQDRNKGQSVESTAKFSVENKPLSYKTKFQLLENLSNDPSIKVLSLFSNIPDPHELDHKMNDHGERKNNKPFVRNCFQLIKPNQIVQHINNSIPFLKSITSINENSLNEMNNINWDQSNHELINTNSSPFNNINTYKKFPTAMQIIEVSNKSLTKRQINPIKCKQIMSGQG